MKRSTALKRFLSILFVILLISSCVLLAACSSRVMNPPEDEDPGTTTEEPDEEDEILEVIKNGKFDQYNDTSATAFPVTPKNWSYAADSYAGQSAPITSGDFTRYGTISTNGETYETDKSKFKTTSMTDPLANPGYPVNRDAEDDEFNDKILMLQNIKPTAVKYRSASISVPLNSYALISVYVKTVLVKEDGTFYASEDSLKSGQGATISLTGGTDKPVILYGIQTAGEWKEYQFIIEGSSVAAKNITLELGLGTGSPANTIGYTEGFAFFAETKMEYITKKAFNEKNAPSEVIKRSDNNEPLQYDGMTYGNLKVEDPKTAETVISYTFKNGNAAPSLNNFTATGPDSISGSFGNFFGYNNNISNGSAPDELKKDLENFPFSDENIAYIQKTTTDNYSMGFVNEDFLSVREGQYYRISFWAKTSKLDRSGLNVYLTYVSEYGNDVEVKYKEILNIETTQYNLTKEEKDKVTNANLYDGWRQYSFFVDGGVFERANADKKVSLEIWFGSISISYKATNDGEDGNFDTLRSVSRYNTANFPQNGSYAMVTNLEVEALSKTIYNSASSAENSITGFSLSSRSTGTPGISNGSFNNVKPADADVANRPMLPENFTGMYKQDSAQGGVYGGIINTNLQSNYTTAAAPWLNPFLNAVDILKAIGGDSWNSLLMIYNQELTAYGYASDYMTLSANSYKQISVDVKAMPGTTANIYLVDKEGNRLDNYILNEFGERVSQDKLRDELVYNPYYEEKYDKESDKYGPEEDYDANSPENKLLRKGTKLVVASTIPVQNPFYDEDFRKVEEDKELTWKKELTKYFLYDRTFWEEQSITNENESLYAFIDINYNDKAEHLNIASVNVNDDFVTYTFFIKTGNTAKDVRLELWNGGKYAETPSQGAVFFDNAISRTMTQEEFYEYVFNENKIFNEHIANAMFFDMSGYDNIPDPSLSESDVDEETPTTPAPGSDFEWSSLLIIIPSTLILLALLVIVIRKWFMKDKKTAEQTATDAPAYARQKTSKKSGDNDKDNRKFE